MICQWRLEGKNKGGEIYFQEAPGKKQEYSIELDSAEIYRAVRMCRVQGEAWVNTYIHTYEHTYICTR